MKTNKTFAGIDEQYAKESTAKITLIPVPFDQTSTWIKGADKAVEAFLEAAENMELYDIETDSEVYKEGIFLTDELPKQVDPESMVNWVHQKVKSYLGRNKFVSLFGGEHSISIGAIRAFNEYYQDLTVVQIDAHADLRNVYNGSAYNHACAMFEASSSTNLIQVGIRSMDRSECSVMDYNKVFFADQIFEDEYWMEKAVNLMSDKVYITFDLDALDPSIMPSTGTPEPGGLLWYETLSFLKMIFSEKNVVGFDLVELCPNPNNKAPDFLAAKLYYKMLSYKFSTKNLS